METKEIWKDIEGWEGYQVSNWGRVKSCERVVIDTLGRRQPFKETILIPHINKGYLRVNLKRKHYPIHRLVAEAFLSNPDNLPCVNHKNEIKTDNRVENLEFCSYEYNINYGTRNQRVSESKINGITSKCIYQLSLDGSEIINLWQSTMEVQRQLGWASGSISACANGKRNHAYNYKWQYADDLLKPFRQENKEELTNP